MWNGASARPRIRPRRAALLEEMYSLVPKHKGTDHLRADLRRQLSRLKDEAQARKKHGSHQETYHVDREGAGQAVVIGPGNVGKSALITALTRAQPEVSPAPYTHPQACTRDDARGEHPGPARGYALDGPGAMPSRLCSTWCAGQTWFWSWSISRPIL